MASQRSSAIDDGRSADERTPEAVTGSDDPTIVAVGDSALWCTGTRFADKTPNQVHKRLTGSGLGPNGDPIPLSHFRARGGAIIGVDYPWRVTHTKSTSPRNNWRSKLSRKKRRCRSEVNANGWNADECKVGFGGPKLQLNRNIEYLDPGTGYYGFEKHDAKSWYDYYDSPPDENDIDQIKWTVARDIGWHWPRVVDQIEQFPSRQRGQSRPTFSDVPNRRLNHLGDVPKRKPPYAEDVDLLLVNGGTNDLELGWLNNPLHVERPAIRAACRKHCYEDVKTLIGRARDRFPNAVVVVVGYFPWASDWTSRKKAMQFLEAQTGVNVVQPLAEAATDNVQNFARFHVHWMRKAVAEKAKADTGPGILFAARGYGVINCLDAPESWTWGVPSNVTDDTGRYRASHSDNAGNQANACRAKHDGSIPAGCSQASIGHPDRVGSRETAEAIVDRYTEYFDLSLGEATTEWEGGRPASVREACETYDLDPTDSLRYCLSHRVVDSIRVDVRTGSSLKGTRNAGGGGTKAIDPLNDVYLRIEPGRNGTAEEFRLETESNDFQRGSTDSFCIDPMMGKKISNDVGPVPEQKGMDSETWDYQQHIERDHNWEPDHVARTNHGNLPYDPDRTWDTERLRLGEVKRLSLRIEDTNPWDLQEVTVEFNGHIEKRTDVDPGDTGLEGDHDITIFQR